MTAATERAWSLTSVDLAVLMERVGRDRVPFPFSWTTAARTAADLRAERRGSDARIDDPALLAAAGLLADTGPHLTVCGTGTASADRHLRVRIRAALASPSTPDGSARAVVVVQRPALGSDHGGDVRILSVTPGSVGRVVAEALPTVTAGTMPLMRLARTSLLTAPPSVLHDSVAVDVRARVAAILDGPRTGLGEIVVGRATLADGPLEPVGGCRWLDVPGDGRYLLDVADIVAVRPATIDALAGAIDRALERVGAQEDDRTGAVPPGTLPRG